MPTGRQTRRLTKDQAQRLEEFRKGRHDGAPGGYSLPQLRAAMDAPFTYKTLGKALKGAPVWDLHHSWIVSWIEQYLGKAEPVIDGKAAASGEREEPNGDTEAARTVRGSR